MATVQLTTAQKVRGWDFKLNEMSRPRDIFGLVRGIYRDGEPVKNSFLVSTKSGSGEMRKTMTLIKDLVGTGRFGKQGLLGYEEIQSTQEMSVYADEVKHGVPYETYGYQFAEKDPYGFIPKINGMVSDWHEKMDGLRIRQAICEKLDQALVHAQTNTGLSASNKYPHSNIFVVGNTVAGTEFIASTAQPAYSATIATYAGAINTLITDGTKGWAVANQVMPKSTKFLDVIVEWAATNRLIQGISGLGSELVYIHTMPTHAVTETMEIVQKLNMYTDGEKARMGGLGRIYRNLILAEDVKAPRCTIAASTLTFSYWGITDSRAAAGNTAADVGFLLGASAVFEYVVERMHWEKEVQNYGQTVGLGAFRTNGYNRCDWDDVDGTNSDNRKNYTSGLIFYKSN